MVCIMVREKDLGFPVILQILLMKQDFFLRTMLLGVAVMNGCSLNNYVFEISSLKVSAS